MSIYGKLAAKAALAASLLVLAGCSGHNSAATAFDGERAYASIKKQCDIGPRFAGSPGRKPMLEMLKSELGQTADQVSGKPFKAKVNGKTLEFQNVYAVFNPNAKRFVLLCAHWDTRPMADQEVDEKKRVQPIPGADDGASGVAVLLELARTFKAEKPKVGVVMAFFDGEDYGKGPTDMFIGSKEFAQNWKTAVTPGGREIKYDYGILLDMIGDKELTIPKEKLSDGAAKNVVDKVWATAKTLGHGDVFLDEVKYSISDDHLPLLAAGIKCIDVIDFDYAPWHTLDDTPDKCSAKSLKTVGDVIAKVIYDEEP